MKIEQYSVEYLLCRSGDLLYEDLHQPEDRGSPIPTSIGHIVRVTSTGPRGQVAKA